jgi:hypothetical protein
MSEKNNEEIITVELFRHWYFDKESNSIMYIETDCSWQDLHLSSQSNITYLLADTVVRHAFNLSELIK